MHATTDSAAVRTRAPGAIRERLLDAAEQVFLEVGFADGNTNDVLKIAGGSKATLFKYFPTKEALYGAMIARVHTRSLAPPIEALADEDPRAFLAGFGVKVLSFLLNPVQVKVARLLVADAQRFPSINEPFYAAGPALILDTVSERLERWTAEGKLACADPQGDAVRWLDMLASGELMRAFYGFGPPPTPDRLRAVANAAMEIFLDGRGCAVAS